MRFLLRSPLFDFFFAFIRDALQATVMHIRILGMAVSTAHHLDLHIFGAPLHFLYGHLTHIGYFGLGFLAAAPMINAGACWVTFGANPFPSGDQRSG